MKEILDLMQSYCDKEYASFQAKLTPTIARDKFIGIRMPDCRIIAKKIKGSYLEEKFLNELPHKYYDENMLHSVILNSFTKYDQSIKETIKFLPYVDNWATCDTMHSIGLGKDKVDLLKHIREWITSDHIYIVRFGIHCLMTYYLDEAFDKSYLDLVGSIKSNEYYVNMMIAWYFATALAKQYDETIKYIESKTLLSWVQNKTIQKAKESFRITKDRKEYLETLKIK